MAATSAVLLSGDPASAAAHTVTVSFTADGPSPASVTIEPGDQVVYRNTVDPNAGSVLGVVTGAVKSVAVTVEDAAQSPFSLDPGQSRALTYSNAVRAVYTATYHPTMVLGLLPARDATTTGTVLVRAVSGGSVPVVTPAPPASGGAVSPLTQSGGQAVGSAPASDAGTAGQPAGPQVNYTPNPGDVAAGQMPRNGSAAGAPSRPRSAPSAASGSNLDTPDGVTELPQLGSASSQPRQLDRASSDRPVGSLGLPSITAVVLLSMVSAGLVRTIMVRHTSLA
ncbi:MAG TPA: hypothetical protein VFX70_13305 [Mycobacteriales bacterium]|nr:hypothetical protein [Mycobacteriales bacterium]